MAISNEKINAANTSEADTLRTHLRAVVNIAIWYGSCLVGEVILIDWNCKGCTSHGNLPHTVDCKVKGAKEAIAAAEKVLGPADPKERK